MTTQVRISPAKNATCEWCGRTPIEPLVTVTVVTSRLVFRDEVCEACRKAFADEDDAA